ncbi:MAG TPA: M56 family metallopeptidase [Bacteroidales bacterium]
MFLKKELRFNYLRYFLLTSIVLSLLIPFSPFRIHLDLSSNNNVKEETIRETKNAVTQTNELAINQAKLKPETTSFRNASIILIYIYITGLIFCGLRLLTHFFRILYLFIISERIRQQKTTIITNERMENPFSFFNWIFIPKNQLVQNLDEDILRHERIHASQYHSIDLIMIELLSAVMWFNPLVWMMKNSVQLVHEYLADEGVLNTGTDKLRYQALLINQVAEESLICLSSSFNHSLIKKRMIMMNKSKFNKGSKLSILALISLATVLFFAVACVNGQTGTDKGNFSITPKVNYLYKWALNPLNVNMPSDAKLQTDNGEIKVVNGEVFVVPSKEGELKISSKPNGVEFSQVFKVTSLPNPKFIVGGEILVLGSKTSVDKLLQNRELHVYYADGLQATYDVVEYRIYYNQDGPNEEKFVISGNKVSDKEIEIIKNGLASGKKVILDYLKLNFPDGSYRYHGTFSIEK